jgi:hypothetical protein
MEVGKCLPYKDEYGSNTGLGEHIVESISIAIHLFPSSRRMHHPIRLLLLHC